MRSIILSVVLLFVVNSTSQAQWSWTKAVGVSGSTEWDAASIDETGNFYFSGYSDKLAGSSPRAYVTGKYDHEGNAQWNTKLLTASLVTGASNGVDASGNSYMIQGVLAGQKIKLPDGSEFSHYGSYYFVSKYNANGSLAWAKKLTIPQYSRFQVLADGTVCILATNVQYYVLFGTDSIPTSQAYSSFFLEIKTDGSIGRMVSTAEFDGFSPTFLQWTEPGKLFVINSLSIYSPIYRRATIDLEAKTMTPQGDSLVVTGQLGFLFIWHNNGLPNSPTTVLDPKTGHIFALMSSNTADCYLNKNDTIHFRANNQTMEGYVVELDENMKVVRKVLLTNPLQLAVRDSLVVVTAIVRATSGFGFHSPDITVNITKTSNNQDGYVVYVMDREFHYKRHGLVEGQIQKLFSPYATLISSTGEVFISLSADGDLYFQGMPPFSAHSGTVLAKLDGPAAAAVSEHPDQLSTIFPNPASKSITIAQPGAFTFHLTDILGHEINSGSATDKINYDISAISAGSYFIIIETEHSREIRAIKKL